MSEEAETCIAVFILKAVRARHGDLDPILCSDILLGTKDVLRILRTYGDDAFEKLEEAEALEEAWRQ